MRIERGGEIFRPRTLLQALLVARLCAHHPEPILRTETADMLWPLADHGHALAYLRRAVMELRKAGFPVVSHGSRLALNAAQVSCDMMTLREGGMHITAPIDILPDVDHSVADEIRQIVHQLASDEGKTEQFVVGARGQDEVLARLGSFLIDSHPDIAVDFLSRQPDLFAKASAQDALLQLTKKLTEASPAITDGGIRLRIMAAKVARQRTKYRLAETWLLEALDPCRERGLFGDLANLYDEYAFLEMERRNWDAAQMCGERAVEAALRHGEPETLAAAYSSLGRTQWQVLGYESAAANFQEALRLSSIRARRTAILANLSFLWGVLQVPFELTEEGDFLPEDGFYAAGADSYRQFATHFGRGEFRLAAQAATKTIEITARNDMDRFFCVALDCAAIAFAGLNRPAEAAACVRCSSRLRVLIGHQRAPMEKDALRRHLHGGYFGPAIAEVEQSLRSDDLTIIAARVAKRLRARRPISAP